MINEDEWGADEAQPIVLGASELWAKHGFCDGDILSDYGWQVGDEWYDEHRVLIHLVRQYLVPEIRRRGHTVALDEIETIHNPIRVSSWNGRMFDQWLGTEPEGIERIYVHVTRAQIRAAIDEVLG